MGRPDVWELGEQIGVGPYFILRYLPIREDSQKGILDVVGQCKRKSLRVKSRRPCRRRRSANTRQLFTRKHIDHSFSADACVHYDEPGMIVGDLPNYRSFSAQWMGLYGGKNTVCIRRGDNGEKFAFVGDIKRIEAENFARAFHFFADRNRIFIEKHADFGCLGDLCECAGDAAASWIAQHMNVFARGQNCFAPSH